MNEVQIWEHVIKWGLAQNPELSSDPKSYSKGDFDALKNTLQQCIPFIRFHNLTSKEFSNNILPYREILPKELYENLLNDFLDNNYKPIKKSNPRIIEEIKEIKEINPKNIKNIDSRIIKFQHTELISKWIDRLEITDKIKNYYEFKLLYRSELDFSGKFHEICDNQPGTVTVVKLKGSNEILGGFNPIKWKYVYDYSATKDSFIFSFKDSDSIVNHILSRVKDEAKALYNGNHGPSFGHSDLRIYYSNYVNKWGVCCRKASYEKLIRPITGADSVIEKYEVFRIVKA
ncbi:hypothetical protein C1646_43787 [Rhizophagus diaphanus]|nr:hypothetical protein C1646_43787 [Rhizophagus diaphanus] [Rhizophagus sp. MUCL 43196]